MKWNALNLIALGGIKYKILNKNNGGNFFFVLFLGQSGGGGGGGWIPLSPSHMKLKIAHDNQG